LQGLFWPEPELAIGFEKLFQIYFFVITWALLVWHCGGSTPQQLLVAWRAGSWIRARFDRMLFFLKILSAAAGAVG
jgi:hypothetical protein